jgi:hypothetical protein
MWKRLAGDSVSSVKVRIPNTNRSFEGQLVGIDKQSQLLIVALGEEAQNLRPNSLVTVNLTVGGVPRTMTVVVGQSRKTARACVLSRA